MNLNATMKHLVARRPRGLRTLASSAGWLALLVMLLGLALPAMAQLDTGSISGTVLDQTGKVVTGAQVSIREAATGTAYATVSSSAGYYVFPSVRTGTYEVKVAATGFKVAVRHGVLVSVSAHSAQDFTLAVGSNAETVSVTAGGEALETETSDIGDAIQPVQVADLPLTITGGFRSLETLEFLVPGVVGVGMQSANDAIKINGGQEEGTDFLIDGITTNRQQDGSNSFGIISPSVDAVNEFHISLSALPAELGRTTGGLANFNTKGGTNKYHGEIYEFYKNNVLDANTWFANADIAQQGNTAAAKTQFKRAADTKNDYGLNLGGPVNIPHFYKGKDKTFFFFNWEQWRQNYGGPVTSLLPTPAELGADGQFFDFSSTLGGQILNTTGNCGQNFPLYYGEIFDPAYEYVPSNGGGGCRYVAFGQTYNNTTFKASGTPNNKIPVNRASKIAQNMINTYLMPLAKQEVSGSAIYNYVNRDPGVITNTAYSFRIDQNMGTNHKIWGFWSSRENTNSGGNSNLPVPIQTCCGTVDQLGKIFRAGWDYIVTPTIVNSLTIGSNRSNNINRSKASVMGTAWDQQLGIANGFSDDFPVFQFNGNSFGGMGEATHSTDTDNVLAMNDILHWQHGAHSVKFGGELQYHQYSWVSQIGGTCSGNAGCMQFWDNQTASDTHFWGQDGNSFAAFLIGQAGDINNLKNLHQPRWITHYGAIFAQDDWKVRPNLTLNLGLRWSLDTPRHEADDDTAILNPTKASIRWPGAIGALDFAGTGTGRNGVKGETWGSIYKKDIEPRVGFAWEPDMLSHKLVVRGNGGIYYGPLVYADFGQGTTQGFQVQGNLYTPDPLSGPQLDAGMPVLPTTPNLDPDQLAGTNLTVDYVAKSNGRPGMVETWTLETQYEITPNLIASVGYLGMHSTRLHAMLNFMNDIPNSAMAQGDWLNWWAAAPGPLGWSGPALEPFPNFTCATGCMYPQSEPAYQAFRPFPQFGYINMDSYLQNMGQSSYDALEAKAERRFHNGLSVLASYTFSKTLTDADVIQPYWSTLQNGGAVQDPSNLKGEKAVSSEDVPNNFVISYVYELPVGKGKALLGTMPKPVDMAISNWKISGIQHYLGGQPISIFGATGIPGKNSSIRFNRVAGQPIKNPNYAGPLGFNPANNTTACQTGYFNCAAFYDPNYFPNRDPNGVGASGQGNPWRYGTMPRNSSDIRGPGYSEEDFGINKTIPIHDSIKVEFRGEMFNAFNRHIFTRPNSNMSNSNISAGQVGGLSLGPRQVQFRLVINY
jgi:hypothetical protein